MIEIQIRLRKIQKGVEDRGGRDNWEVSSSHLIQIYIDLYRFIQQQNQNTHPSYTNTNTDPRDTAAGLG